MSYSGLVTRIKIRPHPNADKLALGQCSAYQVVVGKDIPDLALGVFFCVDGQLSEAFCKEHDLITRKDEQGNRAGGYFSENRKVRCQKLRGEKSEGFWMPISCLAFTGVDMSILQEGAEVTVVNGIEICRKYFTPATIRAMGNRAVRPARERKCFPKHFETEQFKREGDRIPKGAVLYVTAKLHGSSARFGLVCDTEELTLPFWKRWINKIYPIFATEKSEWTWLNGSRNVVLEKRIDPTKDFYGSDPFRFKISDPLRGLLHKGEVIYGEIVGFMETGAPIMGTVSIKDKELQKVFGSTMKFSYGNEQGHCSLYVYRIVMINEDGVVTELSDPQMRQRCDQLGLKPVPFACAPFVYDGDLPALKVKLDSLLDKPSIIDSSHIEEGVCVRWDAYPTCKILKHKSFTFLHLEDEQKSKDDFVDKEEVS